MDPWYIYIYNTDEGVPIYCYFPNISVIALGIFSTTFKNPLFGLHADSYSFLNIVYRLIKSLTDYKFYI